EGPTILSPLHPPQKFNDQKTKDETKRVSCRKANRENQNLWQLEKKSMKNKATTNKKK
ncbi:unnamed protein product, partial [Amoebophrya sp. A25]